MLLEGTVVADAATVISDGAIAVADDRILAVGERNELRATYPSFPRHQCDLFMPGLVGGHIHSVQSLGRGIADDTSLLDWLFEYILPMEASLEAEEMALAAQLAYLEIIESGTTTVIDHLSVSHAERVFEVAGEMGIRGCLGKVLMDQRSPAGLQEEADEALAESERLITEFHGSHNDRLRYAVTPRFALSCSEECLRGCRDLVDRYPGVRIHTHASENKREIETVAADTGMRNIEWLHEVGLTGEDVILAHCVWTDETERALLAETNTNVVYCPSSNMKLASGIAPVTDYLDRGICVALGNDGPPCNNTLDAFTEMRQASLLQKVEQLDPTVLPASTIVQMATEYGAQAAGFEKVGKIAPGWKADIIGIDTGNTRASPLHDIFSYLVFAAHGDDVVFSMVDGTILMQNGEVVVADAEAIRRKANAVELDLDAARAEARKVRPD